MISIQDLWARDKADTDVIKMDIVNFVKNLQQNPTDFWKLNFMHGLVIVLNSQDDQLQELLKPLRDDLFNWAHNGYKPGKSNNIQSRINKNKPIENAGQTMDLLRAAVDDHEAK